VGIRLAPGTYIVTTGVAAQQAYTAWTQWAWRENISSAWVGGSEVALVGNGTAAQSDTGALILRVDDKATTFSLQLKQQATTALGILFKLIGRRDDWQVQQVPEEQQLVWLHFAIPRRARRPLPRQPRRPPAVPPQA
jgi:hypothetical protein